MYMCFILYIVAEVDFSMVFFSLMFPLVFCVSVKLKDFKQALSDFFFSYIACLAVNTSKNIVLISSFYLFGESASSA